MADEDRKRAKRQPPRRACDARMVVQLAGVFVGSVFAAWQLYDQVAARLDKREAVEIERQTEHAERRLEAERKYRAAMEKLRELEAGK